jgi:phosphoglycolate phosphatase
LAIGLVIFDLDGTLIDSRRDLAESANALLAAYGAPPIGETDVTRMVGCGAATLVKRVLAAAGLDISIDEALPRFLSAYDERLTRHTRPYDGVPVLLDGLRGQRMPMALLTNKPLAQTASILETFGMTRYFQWSVGGDGPWPRKPGRTCCCRIMEGISISTSE